MHRQNYESYVADKLAKMAYSALMDAQKKSLLGLMRDLSTSSIMQSCSELEFIEKLISDAINRLDKGYEVNHIEHDWRRNEN